jgi:citrate lyase subunit beta / citryl-CoA lyase
MLFVPGQKESWVNKAVASGADAMIFDLEDSVSDSEKASAREIVRNSIQRLDSEGCTQGLWVRSNSWESGIIGLDLESLIDTALEGLLLPKVFDVADVLRVDGLIEHLERKAGREVGSTKLIITLETAQAISSCEAIARCSSRVVSLFGATAKGGDVEREIGYQFTAQGNETLYIRSRIVLACRSAGLAHPLCGVWQEIHDLSGLQSFAQQNRQLGFRGQVILHPSHVGPVHQVFTPSTEELGIS